MGCIGRPIGLTKKLSIVHSGVLSSGTTQHRVVYLGNGAFPGYGAATLATTHAGCPSQSRGPPSNFVVKFTGPKVDIFAYFFIENRVIL